MAEVTARGRATPHRGLNRAAKTVVVTVIQQESAVRLAENVELAQALEHEIDHLNGVLYLDHLESIKYLQRIEPEETQL